MQEVKDHYSRGGLGDVKVKKILMGVLNEILAPIREKRAYYEQHKNEVYDMLFKGSDDARAAAQETLDAVKKAMGINYRDILKNYQIHKTQQV